MYLKIIDGGGMFIKHFLITKKENKFYLKVLSMGKTITSISIKRTSENII